MDLAIALRVLAGWPPFNQLQPKEQARLAETLQPLQLRPGQKLFEHGSLPPGVAYVVKGQLRLLAEQVMEFAGKRALLERAFAPIQDADFLAWA